MNIPDNLRKAETFWDFIEVTLYEEGDGYRVKVGMPYWFAGKELVQHKVTDALVYRDIEKYVNEGMIYVEKRTGTTDI